MVYSKLNILHIEDDPADALLVQEMLQTSSGSSYNLVNVDSLKNALVEIQKKGYNAVLLDLGLNDITGVDAVKALKEENPDIPIIVLSGLDSEEIALRAIKEGAQEYIVKGNGDAHNISRSILYSIQRKEIERKLFYQANYDELTGFPNLRMFTEHMKLELARAKRWGHEVAVMFLDLDKFKEVNDEMGHETGNKILQMVSTRLKTALRSSDFIARYGGDEFIIQVDSNTPQIKREDCIALADKIKALISEPFDLGLGGNKVYIGASIGLAIYPHAGKDIDELIESADQDMYAEKRKFVIQSKYLL